MKHHNGGMGRNKEKCKKYLANGIRLKNKKRRAEKRAKKLAKAASRKCR